MRLVTFDEYKEYVKTHESVRIESAIIPIGKSHKLKEYHPRNFVLETGTVWSFPKRGGWATHKGDYRGNWAPQIPRNLILRYTKPRDWVLDQMCGGGTTLIEAKLLGRNMIGVDINYEAVMLTLDRLNFSYHSLDEKYVEPEIRVYHGDARNLNEIEDNSIDLIATHPPYANIISYSRKKGIGGDLSKIYKLEGYLEGMGKIAEESYRVLKSGRYCAVLIGDTRRHRHYIPIAFRVMQEFLKVGFILKEDVLKVQWNLKSTREKWSGLVETSDAYWGEKPEGKKYWTDFLLILHEHLFIFRKPRRGEDTDKYSYSMRRR